MFLHLISLFTALMSDPYPLNQEISNRIDFLPEVPRGQRGVSQDCIDSRLRGGRCISLNQCPYIVEEFYDEARKSSYGLDFQTFIGNSICGFDGVNFLICCHSSSVYPFSPTKPMAQLQNTPLTFGATANPYLQLPQTTPFIFAPLSGYGPSNTANNNLPPVIYPPIISNTVPPTTATTAPTTPIVIFQPTPSMVGGFPTPTAGQPTTQGTLVSQPVQQPLTPPTTLASTCGVSKATINRVVGGYEAKRGNYPWIAALGFREENNPNSIKYLCGGSLISSKYVITSAHCINNFLTQVLLGAHDLSNPTEAEARNYRVKRTVVHDMFDLKSIANDLALIELSDPVTMSDSITPICLPELPQFFSDDFVGMNPFVAGWGASKHQGPTSNVLKDVQVPVIDRQTCEQSYRTVFNFVQFSEKIICAGNSVVDACQGDSGGPLMMPQMLNNSFRYYLLGVVSFGYECARTGFPGVYSRVAAYLPWIKSNMI